MIELYTTKKYLSQYTELIKRDKNLEKPIRKALDFLQKTPFHPSLRLHKLVLKNTEDVFSISVNMKIRIFIYWEKETSKKMTLMAIGDHSLYKLL